MNGQGPNSQAGFPDRPRQQRPKFNFNSKNVKKEITSDFMAAQLASFGSSAKLKPVPNQQQSDPTKQLGQQQMAPGFGQGIAPGFPQMNQGFRQPMMPQMAFQGQAFMQPQMQYNMQIRSTGVPSVPMGTQGQFSTGPNNTAFSSIGQQPAPFGMPAQVPQPTSFGMSSQPQTTSLGMATQPQSTSFGMATQPQSTSFGMPAQPQAASFGMATQPQSTSFGMPAQPQPTSFGLPSQPKADQGFNSSSSFQGSGDIFNSSNNQAATSNKTSTSANFDPFSNLRSSSSSSKPDNSSQDIFTSASKLPTPSSTANQQEFDAFGAKPFTANIGASSQGANFSQSGMNSGFDDLSAFSSNSSSSMLSSNVSQPPPASASVASSVGQNIGDFSVFNSMSTSLSTPTSISSAGFDGMFGSQQKPSVQKQSVVESAFSTSTPVSTTTNPVTQFESSFNPPAVAPKSDTTFDSVFPSSKPSTIPQKSYVVSDSAFASTKPSKTVPLSAFDDAFASSPSNQNIGFDSAFEPTPFSATPKTSSVFTPPSSSFNAFDDDFAALSSKGGSQTTTSNKQSALPDSFGQTPFSAEKPGFDAFSTHSASSSGGVSAAGLKFPDTAQSASPSQPNQVDLFDTASFNVDTKSTKQNVSIQPEGVDLFSSSGPPSSSIGVVDKYSVFSALNSEFDPTEPSSEVSKPDLSSFQPEHIYAKPQPQTQPEVPVQSFQGTDMFDDSFDPFNEKKAPPPVPAQPNFDQFDVFSQLSTVKTQEVKTEEVKPPAVPQTSGTGSIARQRPSSKTPAMMVVLPPPAKAVDRRKPSKSTPVTASKPAPPSTRPKTSSTAAVFDPFFNNSARPVAPVAASQRKTQVSSQPAPRRAKRRAPPPPTKQPGGSSSTFYSGEKKEAVLSLLDLDFSGPEPVVASSSGPPPPQPLLILPTANIMSASKGAPPSRPPPPKSGEDTTAVKSTFGGMPPPLPPRPGPGHVLYHHILKTGPYCVALFEFEAENNDELNFKAGDGIKLDSDISDEWFAGSIGNKRGIFPKNCVEVKIPLPARPSAAATAPSPAPSASPAPSPTPAPIDWSAATTANQETTPPKDILDAWGDSRTPSPPPCVPDEPEPIRAPTPEPVATPEEPVTTPEQDAAPIGTCTAIYSFEAQESDELTVTEGVTIEVIEFVDDDWIKGKVGDKVGIFPRSYASFGDEELEEELEEILDEETRSVNVFYDFEPGAEDELSLSAGDMVAVISFVGDEWIKGRFKGREGIFPACFVPAIPDHWNIPEESETFTENFETTEESSSSSSSSSSGDEKDRMSEISDSRSYSAEPSSDLGRVQMIADFEAQNDFEMSVKTGDIVKITARLNELWLEGECDGNSGILPATFVKWLDASPEPDIIGNPAVTERGELERQDTIKSSMESTNTEENPAPLSSGFSEGNPFAQEFGMGAPPPNQETTTGDLPPPPSQEDLDKTLVSSENPFTTDMQVEQVAVESPTPSTPTIAPSVKSGDKRKALFDFTSVNDDELDFSQGDIIEVTEFLNEDWLRGKCRGKEGLFPITFTEDFHQ